VASTPSVNVPGVINPVGAAMSAAADDSGSALLLGAAVSELADEVADEVADEPELLLPQAPNASMKIKQLTTIPNLCATTRFTPIPPCNFIFFIYAKLPSP
jgi:hypothetical protein